jgi:hypothetical protein
MTESKSRQKTNPPLDSCRDRKSLIARRRGTRLVLHKAREKVRHDFRRFYVRQRPFRRRDNMEFYMKLLKKSGCETFQESFGTVNAFNLNRKRLRYMVKMPLFNPRL